MSLNLSPWHFVNVELADTCLQEVVPRRGPELPMPARLRLSAAFSR